MKQALLTLFAVAVPILLVTSCVASAKGDTSESPVQTEADRDMVGATPTSRSGLRWFEIEPTLMPLPNDWHNEWSLPNSILWETSSMAVDSKGQLWITSYNEEEDPSLLRYDPESRDLVTYTVLAEDGVGLPTQVFASKDGRVWGVGFFYIDLSDDELSRQKTFRDYPRWMLSFYDEKSDQFIQARDKDGVLWGTRAPTVAERVDGTLWLSIDGRLVRFDPVNEQVAFVDVEELNGKFVSGLAAAPDGKLWMVIEDPAFDVLWYNPRTGEAQTIRRPSDAQPGTGPGPIYLTQEGHLWLSYSTSSLTSSGLAWLDINKSELRWNIISADVFMTETILGVGHPSPAPVDQIYQTSDGLIWFISRAGLVSYDPRGDQWRLVHQAPVYQFLGRPSLGIVEDRDGVLWVGARRNLVKHRLRQ